MNIQEKKKLISCLSNQLTAKRADKIDHILAQRTRYVTVVTENVQKPQNINALVRTAECLGLQEVHIIDDHNRYGVNKGVTRGASDWLDIIQYKNESMNTKEAFDNLKSRGYKIVAATPHAQGYEPSTIPIAHKTALIFGTEKMGLSDYAIEHADEFVSIPMYGFTESFNVSVSAALCLYDIITRLRASSISWHLTEEELVDLKISWLRKTVVGASELERRCMEV